MNKLNENRISENFYEFQIALSFANEDRPYVDQVANLLRSYNIRVFYDLFEEATLWGKNLYDYLSDVYQNKALYTIMFISKNYARKLWTNHERKSMQSRAFKENMEYILPARFDNTPIPGIDDTILYISLVDLSPEKFVKKIIEKLEKTDKTINLKTYCPEIQNEFSKANNFDKNCNNSKADSKFKIFGGNIGVVGDNVKIENFNKFIKDSKKENAD
jgi:hypothetical protein